MSVHIATKRYKQSGSSGFYHKHLINIS